MSTEDNKAIVRRFYEEVVNQKKRAALDEVFDPNLVDHFAPPGKPGGLEGAKQTLGMFLTAFPDLHFTVEDLIAEGDEVVARVTMSGTQHGAFMGIPPTGKHVTLSGTEIFRIADGRIVEQWAQFDVISALRQFGVVPPPGQ